MEQQSFLDDAGRAKAYEPYRGMPGHRGVASQIEASEKVAPHVSKMQQRILDALKEHGGLTRKELADKAKMPLQSVCGRVRELVLKGKIKDTDERRDGGNVVRAA